MFTIISNNEKAFIKRKLNNIPMIRDYQRNENEYREISIRHLFSNGQVEVKLGKTIIITQIIPKLIKPFSDRPNEGQLVFNIDTNNLKPNTEYNSKNESLNEFRNRINIFLEKTLKESKALDVYSLCIIPGKLAWKMVIDVNIINNDGNVLDASLISVLSSWLTIKVPFFIEKEGKIVNNNKYVNLTVLHKPFICTFGIFENESNSINFISDCNLKEESIMSGFISVAANIFGEVVYMQMSANVQISATEISDLLMKVKKNVYYINNKLNSFVEEQKYDEQKILNELDNFMNFSNDVIMKDDSDLRGFKFIEKVKKSNVIHNNILELNN